MSGVSHLVDRVLVAVVALCLVVAAGATPASQPSCSEHDPQLAAPGLVAKITQRRVGQDLPDRSEPVVIAVAPPPIAVVVPPRASVVARTATAATTTLAVVACRSSRGPPVESS